MKKKKYFKRNSNPRKKIPNCRKDSPKERKGGNKTCWNCGKEGHFANKCPEPKKDKVVKSPELADFEGMDIVYNAEVEDLSDDSSIYSVLSTSESESETDERPSTETEIETQPECCYMLRPFSAIPTSKELYDDDEAQEERDPNRSLEYLKKFEEKDDLRIRHDPKDCYQEYLGEHWVFTHARCWKPCHPWDDRVKYDEGEYLCDHDGNHRCNFYLRTVKGNFLCERCYDTFHYYEPILVCFDCGLHYHERCFLECLKEQCPAGISKAVANVLIDWKWEKAGRRPELLAPPALEVDLNDLSRYADEVEEEGPWNKEEYIASRFTVLKLKEPAEEEEDEVVVYSPPRNKDKPSSSRRKFRASLLTHRKPPPETEPVLKVEEQRKNRKVDYATFFYGTKPIIALIDTGCSVSIALGIINPKDIIPLENPKAVITANGSMNIITHKTRKIWLTQQEVRIEIELHIFKELEGQSQMMLGKDFLNSHLPYFKDIGILTILVEDRLDTTIKIDTEEEKEL